ncbi:hypothetical protein [Nocardia sp. NPDC004750]
MFATVSREDLLPGLAKVARTGWRVMDDAVLLKRWYKSYHGNRAAFAGLLDYEIAVNGRGIYDLDLEVSGVERVPALLRRGAAFAWAALHTACRDVPRSRLAAYISAAPVYATPEVYTGNVTFCALRPGQPPYVGQDADHIVVALFSEDCAQPLPGTPRGWFHFAR